MATQVRPDLISELRSIVGADSVLTGAGDLHAYAFDSALDRATPSAVVLPGTRAELIKVVQALARARQAFVARGAATSLCGGPVPLNGSVVVGTARLRQISAVDTVNRQVRADPGVVNLKLQQAVASHGLFYAPDPGSQKACTIGGNVATNAGGPHCLKYGVTSNSVVALEVILANGQVHNLSVHDPGFDLVGFFVGSEGTLGAVSQITLKLHPKPAHVRTMVVSFRSIEEAIQTVTDIIAAGILPATLEAMDKTTVEAIEEFAHAGYPVEAEAVLLIEVDGDDETALDRDVEKIRDLCAGNRSFDFLFAKDEKERQRLWEGRRGAYAAMARLAPNVLVEDGAVPRTKLPEALKRIKEIAARHNLRVSLLFHAGDGNLHPQIIFDERNAEETAIVKRAGYEMLKACVDLGGTISGEHGVGIDKREAMKWLFTRETLSLFRRLKNAFDPQNLANPDKLIPLVIKSEPEFKQSFDEMSISDSTALQGIRPETPEQLCEIAREFVAHRKPFGVQGAETRYSTREINLIRMTNLNNVLDFDRGNLSLRVEAGARLADVRAEVEKAGQYLWVAGDGTVGGCLASRASAVPPLRDLVLGMRLLLPNGDLVELGAKTMKNVAGYDAAKLLLGSWGTLAVIVDVTFRLFPFPAPKLETGPLRLFPYRELHKKVKEAFDPYHLLGLRTSGMSASDIGMIKDMVARASIEPEGGKGGLASGGDPFWRM